MNNKGIAVFISVLVIAAAAYFAYTYIMPGQAEQQVDATPQAMTVSGTYTCLPHLSTTGPQTEECAFGIKADAGDYYAVNFGQSADAMNQFQSEQHVQAEGFFVPKEALSASQWQKYNMKGIFTVTRVIGTSTTPAVGAKININAVCEGALAYMTFADAASANLFVQECKEGKHPEVIEHYKAGLNIDGAAI